MRVTSVGAPGRKVATGFTGTNFGPSGQYTGASQSAGGRYRHRETATPTPSPTTPKPPAVTTLRGLRELKVGNLKKASTSKNSLSKARSAPKPRDIKKEVLDDLKKCKARPTNNKPKGGGGGSKAFVPWCG